MIRKILLSLVAVVPLLGISSALAVTPEEYKVAQSPESQPMQQEQRQNVEFQSPTASGESIVGRVYDVVGDVVSVDLENGGTRQITVSKGHRGTLGHLIGQRVIISGSSLRQIALAPSAIVATPIASSQRSETTITQQQTSQTVEQQVVTPEPTPAPAPVAPAPVAPAPVAPAPAATPRVIPQTW